MSLPKNKLVKFEGYFKILKISFSSRNRPLVHGIVILLFGKGLLHGIVISIRITIPLRTYSSYFF
jgi:hypothetical protein